MAGRLDLLRLHGDDPIAWLLAVDGQDGSRGDQEHGPINRRREPQKKEVERSFRVTTHHRQHGSPRRQRPPSFRRAVASWRRTVIVVRRCAGG